MNQTNKDQEAIITERFGEPLARPEIQEAAKPKRVKQQQKKTKES